jgi:uncharacterized membrane protein (DUF106 family)
MFRMELVMEIIKVVLGMVAAAVIISAIYSTIQYFRLYRPMMKQIRETGESLKEEA